MLQPFACVLLALLAAATAAAQREGGRGGQGGGQGGDGAGRGGNRPAAGSPANPAPNDPAAGAPARGAPARGAPAQGAPAQGPQALGADAGKAKDAPPPAPADPEVAKAALRDFHAGWAKASLPLKVAAVEKLAAVGGEDVAKALAARLTDPTALVRQSIAEALGRLRQPKAVGDLGDALAREIDDKDGSLPAILAMCTALGAIGDAKAVPALTHGVFAGNDRAENWLAIVEARLAAVGQIKDKASVDALIDLLGRAPTTGGRRATGGGRGGGGGNSRVQRLVENPLRKLTRENHADADAWRDWWKTARAKFTF
jgi:HEAT repeat protein